MEQAWRLLRLTPAEIELEFEALAARRQLQMEQADLAAWLAGRYVLMAVHAPKKFPRSPDGVRRRPEMMSPGQMKQVFAGIAARGGKQNGNC